MNVEKPSFFAQSRSELNHWIKANGFPSFRGQQLLDWVFGKRVSSLGAMSNLPKLIRNKLAEDFHWQLPDVVERIDSDDGASKLLLKGMRDQMVESVILRYEHRTSLCISSQVGCKLSCSFCQTGKLGYFRNLSTAEIVGQFLLAQRIVAAEGRNISHIVFMGMGEPLDNYDNVVKAVNLFTKDYGLSYRRVTISTSGMVPRIHQLAEDCKASLAISLHACRDSLRSEMMPINRKYNLELLKEALVAYQRKTGDKITFEYILIKDLNCGRREAKELVRFVHGLKAKINLIPFNSHPGLSYQRPSEESIRAFQTYLSSRHLPAPVRYSLGLEASAACGQLAAKAKATLGQVPVRTAVLAARAEHRSNVLSQ